MNKSVLLGFLLTVVIFGSLYFVFQPAGKATSNTLNPQAFAKLATDSTYAILDVRTAAEYQQGHLANAQNIDFYQSTAFITAVEKLDKTRKYLIYCRSGNRSTQAIAQMKALGFTHLTELQGGLVNWQAANLPIAN